MDAQRGIARRMIIGLPAEGLMPAWEKDFAAYPPAGVIVFRRDFRDLEDLRRLTGRLRELARPRRLFIAIDEEGGFVSQLSGHLVVPPNALLLARGAKPGDIEWASRVTGERLRALGIDWVFAPVADIHTQPLNPVIGPRAYGRTAEEVTARVGEALQGFRAAGIATALKHFPGHGDTLLDSHHALPVNSAPRELLERRELAPFREHLGVSAVMSAHLVAPALDPERPATFSRLILHDLLRGALGFDGVCITDALEMKGASSSREPAEAARQALEAGCDLVLFAFHDEALRRARLELARALVDGQIDRTNFDAARPRLARFDADHPEPTEAELAKPLEALTPPDWVDRMGAIIERGLEVRGALPAGVRGAWKIVEPAHAFGSSLGEELGAAGLEVTGSGEAAVHVEAVATRVPLADSEIARLRDEARKRPTVLVGLQNDAFLDAAPEAVVRISAADATPLTRRVIAQRLAQVSHLARERV
jgi:beta-glucosidase-like glycosyl hydrolase